jgi:hypothetical protein
MWEWGDDRGVADDPPLKRTAERWPSISDAGLQACSIDGGIEVQPPPTSLGATVKSKRAIKDCCRRGRSSGHVGRSSGHVLPLGGPEVAGSGHALRQR